MKVTGAAMSNDDSEHHGTNRSRRPIGDGSAHLADVAIDGVGEI